MNKLATLLLSVLIACFAFVAAPSAAHAAQYQAEFSNGSPYTGPGPRVNFGQVMNPEEYMVVGAYNGVDNIDTKNRPLEIYNGATYDPITVQIIGLPDVMSSPADADIQPLLIDAKTGKLYIK